MAETIFEFPWRVSLAGYKATEGTLASAEQNEMLLISEVPAGVEDQVKLYYPLEQYPALFKTFADLDFSNQSICDFANKYGFLGEGNTWVAVPDHKNAMWGESLQTWSNQIDRMNRAINLWDLARERDIESLKKTINWIGDTRIDYRYETAKSKGGHTLNADATAFDHFAHGDLVAPAKYFVQGIVNGELVGRISPRLLWEKKWLHLGLHFYPSNLLGALWLQLATAIDQNAKFKRCEVCRSWFKVSKANRVDRRLCSDACRTRAYRTRRAEQTKKAAAAKVGKSRKTKGAKRHGNQ